MKKRDFWKQKGDKMQIAAKKEQLTGRSAVLIYGADVSRIDMPQRIMPSSRLAASR